jgi:hypothetical protein
MHKTVRTAHMSVLQIAVPLSGLDRTSESGPSIFTAVQEQLRLRRFTPLKSLREQSAPSYSNAPAI